MTQNSPKWLWNDPNWSKMAQIWPKIAKNDPKWPKMTQNDQNWPKMAKNDPKLPKNDPKWPSAAFLHLCSIYSSDTFLPVAQLFSLEIKLFMSRRVQAEDSWISDTRCWGNCSIPLVDRLQENEGGGGLSLQVFLRMERTIWTLDTAQAHRRTSGRPTAPHSSRLQRRQAAVCQRWEGWTFW